MVDTVDQAIVWHLRTPDMGAAEWEAFTAWLEASPAHAEAYDRVAAGDRTQPLPQPKSRPIVAPPLRRRLPWGIAAGGVAAASAALLMFGLPAQRGASPYEIVTAPGEQRTVTLDDGTSVQMNGGTRLKLDHADTRVATLESGEAVFRVKHNADAPFRLVSGAVAVEDVGTVFNAVRDGSRFDVAVAEGAVRFVTAGRSVLLGQGSGLSFRGTSASLFRIAPGEVGGWRGGRLTFQTETMRYVADAVARRTGAKLSLAPQLSAKPFTGIVNVTGDARRDVPHIAALMGVNWRRDGEQWILAPR